jgi:carboxylesterase
MRYKIDLNGGDKAALLIHGLTGTPFEMKHLADRLHKAGFSVRVPCLAGHGKTPDDLKGMNWQDWYGTVRRHFEDLKKRHEAVSVSGLCMGTLLALRLAHECKEEIKSLSLLSTTLFYDGWSLPWYKFLFPLVYLTPLRHAYAYEEREPYGIKNQSLRKRYAFHLKTNSIGYARIPSECMHELYKLVKVVKKLLPDITTPTLLIHSQEDDLASIRNAEYIKSRIGAKTVQTVYLHDTYHMLTIDNQKDKVSQATIRFFRETMRDAS